MLAEYCKCARDMPYLAADIYTRLADSIRLFNAQARPFPDLLGPSVP
jgi:hypothetical protein